MSDQRQANDRDGRRRDRVRLEIEEECDLPLGPEAIEEITYCRFVAAHEGRRPSYGAIVWGTNQATVDHPAPEYPSRSTFVDDQAPIDVMRQFADGRTSFLVRHPQVGAAIAIDPAWIGSEPALSRFAERTGSTVVQRLATGRVRLFVGQRIYSSDGGEWLTRASAVAYFDRVAEIVDAPRHETARTILELCVHSLSPADVGATLVWFPELGIESGDGLDLAAAYSPPALSAADLDHAPAIAHTLGQVDRAVTLDAEGALRQLNVSLVVGAEHEARQFLGGTRHNSAGKFSASRPDAVVFVVSEDGPTTVFHRGEVVASIDFL